MAFISSVITARMLLALKDDKEGPLFVHFNFELWWTAGLSSQLCVCCFLTKADKRKASYMQSAGWPSGNRNCLQTTSCNFLKMREFGFEVPAKNPVFDPWWLVVALIGHYVRHRCDFRNIGGWGAGLGHFVLATESAVLTPQTNGNAPAPSVILPLVFRTVTDCVQHGTGKIPLFSFNFQTQLRFPQHTQLSLRKSTQNQVSKRFCVTPSSCFLAPLQQGVFSVTKTKPTSPTKRLFTGGPPWNLK